MEFPMATILPANFAFKDADGDVGTVKSLTNADITLLNTALQDIEDLKLCIDDPAPVGFIGLWGEDTLPSGWLLCNGAAVSRSTYAKLFTRIGTKYGAGDGSTTFNLPDFRDRYPIGTGVNTTDTKIAEQLPNINGTVKRIAFPLENVTSGALSTYDYVGLNLGGTGGMGTFSPSPFYTEEVDEFCKKYIYQQTVDAMASEGREFKGIIFIQSKSYSIICNITRACFYAF